MNTLVIRPTPPVTAGDRGATSLRPRQRAAEVSEVRAVSLGCRNTRELLARYSSEVLRAAIDEENAASDCRPVLVALIQAELDRRAAARLKGKK